VRREKGAEMKKIFGVSRRRSRSEKSEEGRPVKRAQDQARSKDPDINVSYVDIDKIKSPKGGRNIDAEIVAALTDSIGCIGLQHPISVTRRRGMVPRYKLVAGAHRLSACQKLGHRKILAHVMSTADARLYKPAENLQRSELKVLDKYGAILDYECARKRVTQNSGTQPHDLGLSGTARELKLNRRIIRQARAARAITEPARLKLISLGLDDHAGVIAKVAEKRSAAEQLKAIDDRAKPRKISKTPVSGRNTGAIPKSAAELFRRWKMSDFKKIFDLSSDLIRDEFVRATFGETSGDGAEWS
jgi:ParB-like chromosome segregation protein Spo0J